MRTGSILLFTFFALMGYCSFAQQPDSVEAPDLPMGDYTSPKEYIINDLHVEGVKYMDPYSLVLASGLMHGDRITIPGENISNAIQRLWDRGYFSDVSIEATPQGDSVNIVIYLQERPRVSAWDFPGVRKGRQAELTEKMNLKVGSELSDYVIAKNEETIRKYYTEKGFLNAEVHTRILTDTSFSNAVKLEFDIERNDKVKIGRITFTGNDNMPDKKLRKAMKKTHQKSFNIFKGAKFDQKNYEADLDNIIDFYNSRGYRNATVVGDSIYQISPKRLGITIDVEEGNKFYFRNITWIGNSIYPTEQLSELLGIRKGDLYDKKTLYKRLGVGMEDDFENPYTVKSLYQNSGYLASQVEPGEVVVAADSIDLEIKIYEGKQFSINNVTFSGNESIDDKVIRRDLDTRPGDMYNRALIMSTLRQLSQSGYFFGESVVPPSINPVSDQLVDIDWPLEERKNDKIDISGGWGNGMFIGSIGLELNNLSMRKMFDKSAWRPYPHGEMQQMRLQFQTNGSYYKSFSLSFTEPWLGGRKPNSLTVGAHYSSETDAYYAWNTPTAYFRTIGIYAGIGRRLKWPDRSFQLYTQVSFQQYNLKNWEYFIINNGSSNILSFKAVLSRNSTDWYVFPRSGSEFSAGVEFTPPYSLWDRHDYSDPNLSDNDRYRWIEFHKWTLKGAWYITPFRNNKFVLATKMEMGAIGAYNKNKRSPFEGYTVGGDGTSGYSIYGVTVVGLRGYENGALTPNTASYASAYNKYAAEFRYHILSEGQTTMYGMVFGEAGNAFDEWKQFNPFQLRRSLGVGVRVFMPMIQMIGVDWAYGFDRAPGASARSGGHPHFYIGMQF